MVDGDRMELCRENADHGCSATAAPPRDLTPRARNPTCEKKTDGQTLQVSSGLRVKLIKNGGDMSHKNEVLLPQAVSGVCPWSTYVHLVHGGIHAPTSDSGLGCALGAHTPHGFPGKMHQRAFFSFIVIERRNNFSLTN
ncbi:hypothetical protein E2C01_073241 [Portunus trituberculatus]|uniref:Uncharacterized protein n=1 Tax=Portunus trituberculatus TaxID=210409 RepID=A0A5B7IDH4_PORTR|nr:hypothetical protein [Portunus trituberculatus]